MASFFEHIGTEVQDVAEANALSAQIAAEAAAVQAEAARDSAISSASDASTSESTATTAQNAAASSATSSAASAATSTTKASEASASESTSTSKAAESAAFAAAASTSESNAASSSTSASNSSSTANTKAVEAAASAASVLTSENNAATSASTSTTQATNSATSAASSLTAKNASEAAKTAAETAETNAATSETNAASSATSATGSASTATTQAGISTTKASEAATSATAAATTLSNITGLSASTGAAGSSAAYDSSTGVLTVPRGDTGATGAAGAAGTQFDTNVLKVDATNNRIGINDTTPSVTLDISGTDAIALPAGTTAQRPTGVAGQFRYNSTLDQFEGFTDEWGAIGGAVGGSTIAADNFTANGSTTAFQLSQVVSSEDSLIIFIEGVFQQQDAFSIATAGGATTLTFGSAPANGRSILIYSISAASLISGSNVNVTSMTGDGSDVTLTLPIAPVANNTQVFISGVYQNKDTYSVSGTTLTFSTAPPTGSEVQVLTLNQTAINVPVDNTITSAKLSGDLTTPGTLTSTGKITADAGIDIDNFNIDGTTIALSSGSMALTTALNLDLNMTGVININDTSDPPSTGEQGGSGSQDTGASIGLTQNDGNLTLRLDKLGKNTVFQHNGVMGTVGFNVDSLSLNAYGATVAVPLTVTNKIYATGLDINDSGTVYTGAGTGRGTIHLDPNSATDFAGNAITFGASDAGSGRTAMAGIYTRTDGTFGSEMHLSTTDSYSAGSKIGIKISNLGVVSVPRGYVSQSLVPAFNAYNTANAMTTMTGIFPHNAVRYNIGGHFSTTSYAFTAPVAGIYHFDFHTIYYGNGTNATINFMKNSVIVEGTYGHFSNASGNIWHTFNLNTTLALAKDDYVRVNVQNMGGITYIHGGVYNEFSGFLVG
jgi:hypothetical protein